jgi:N-acetylneuraminic acid mutarotase
MFSIRQLVSSSSGNGSYDVLPLENMKYARHGHSCCSLGENYIVVTGSRKDIDRAPHRTEIYNTLQNKWTELS